MMRVLALSSTLVSLAAAFVSPKHCGGNYDLLLHLSSSSSGTSYHQSEDRLSRADSRRTFLATTAALVGLVASNSPAEAIGPVKLNLIPTKYSAEPCPPSRPIPGEKAMKGMRGLCVTVEADLEDQPPKDLEKVGVYGFVTDGDTGDSVLANNPDLSTDAGQFAMVQNVSTKDKKVVFDFVAAVPKERDLSGFSNGIGPLNFDSLRLISYPGGQQYGAISPCEMNEFSDECAAWEEQNGPYQRGEFMVKGKQKS